MSFGQGGGESDRGDVRFRPQNQPIVSELSSDRFLYVFDPEEPFRVARPKAVGPEPDL